MSDLKFRLWLYWVEAKHRLGFHEPIPMFTVLFPDDNTDEEPVLINDGRLCLICEAPC